HVTGVQTCALPISAGTWPDRRAPGESAPVSSPASDAGAVPPLLPLHHHGEAHGAGGADRDEPEVHVAPGELVQQCDGQPAACGAERMADRDAPAHHVDPVLVDEPDLVRPAELLPGELVGV